MAPASDTATICPSAHVSSNTRGWSHRCLLRFSSLPLSLSPSLRERFTDRSGSLLSLGLLLFGGLVGSGLGDLGIGAFLFVTACLLGCSSISVPARPRKFPGT